MVFSKAKMVERLTAQGLADQITPEVTAIMDNLDGCDANPSNWRRVVHGDPLLWVVGKDGNGNYVNEKDCI